MNDFPQLLEALDTGKYWVFAALVVGLLIRLLKANPKLEERFPARVRPWLAVALGVLAGVLNAVVAGTPLVRAIILGVVSGGAAVLGHDLVIEGLRDGKEIGKKDIGGPALALLIAVGAARGIAACSPAANRQAANTALSAVQMGCVLYLAETEKPESAIANACQIADQLLPEIRKLLGAKRAELGMRKTGIAVTEGADGGVVTIDAGR